jgi:Kdo2-lipid IVA lauroyltransferase/acyltransferase
LAQTKNRLATRAEYALAKTLVAALQYLPLPLAKQAAVGAARTLDLLIPKLRRVARINLAFAFPKLPEPERERLIDGAFRNVARMILMVARFPKLNSSNIGQWIAYEGLEHYQNAKRCGRGVLVATAHLGNWELSAFAHALMTEPMNVMVRPLDNPLIDELVESRRTLSGNRLIYKWDGARAVLRALRSQEAVGILIDQNTAASEGVFIDFFSKSACANTGFVKLAYHSRAPVVPGFAVWNEATCRYILHFYPPIELSGDETRDTQRIHSVMEEIIRQYPDQWMWIHRRWKTRPLGEPPLY